MEFQKNQQVTVAFDAFIDEVCGPFDAPLYIVRTIDGVRIKAPIGSVYPFCQVQAAENPVPMPQPNGDDMGGEA